jgi:hypothetical protein
LFSIIKFWTWSLTVQTLFHSIWKNFSRQGDTKEMIKELQTFMGLLPLKKEKITFIERLLLTQSYEKLQVLPTFKWIQTILF